MAERLPKRGDLIFPYLSYAIDNGKINDAVQVCMRKSKGLEAFCELILASEALNKKIITDRDIRKSTRYVKSAIQKGVFNELVYGFWLKKKEIEYQFHGRKGIPLSPDIIFLISDKEKRDLEKLIKSQN